MKRLLKKEIKLVPAKVLNMRYCRILKMGEEMNAKDISIADAREILWIEDELRARLITAIGRDFYPPDRIKSTIAELKASIKASLIIAKKSKSKLEPKAMKLEKKLGNKIKFRAIILNSIGVKAAEITVEANTKIDAGKLINKQIRKLGITNATYKIK